MDDVAASQKKPLLDKIAFLFATVRSGRFDAEPIQRCGEFLEHCTKALLGEAEDSPSMKELLEKLQASEHEVEHLRRDKRESAEALGRLTQELREIRDEQDALFEDLSEKTGQTTAQPSSNALIQADATVAPPECLPCSRKPKKVRRGLKKKRRFAESIACDFPDIEGEYMD